MDKIKKYKPFIFITFGILLFTLLNNDGAISDFLSKFFNFVAIFVYGMVISVFLNPLLDYLEHRLKLKRITNIIIIYSGLLLIVSLLLFWGVPSFINNIRTLTNEIPNYIVKFDTTLSDLAVKITYFEKVNFTKELTNLGQMAMNNIENILISFAGSIVKIMELITGFLIALILSGFFLAKKEYFMRLAKEIVSIYFSEKNTVKIYFIQEKLNEVFLGWLHGKTIDSLIIGAIAFVGLLIMGIPYAVFLAVAVTFTNYVPYIGPLVGIVISGMVAFFTVPDKTIIVIIFLFIVQQFDAWYLEARCFKTTLKLDLFWGIAAVLFGGSIGGPIWIILMIPTFALIRDLYLMKKDNFEQEE